MGKTIAGLDVGDKYTHICVLGDELEVEEETRVRTTREGLWKWSGGKSGMTVVLEVGTHSRWISELLCEQGLKALVASARHLRLIYGRDVKTDRTDAEVLARIGRLDVSLLHTVKHRSRSSQSHLAVVRARCALVGSRTKLINHLRGVLKSWGTRLPACSADSICRPEWREELPDALRPALLPVMECITELTVRIKRYDAEIRRLSKEEYQEIRSLQAVCGVGPLTALSYVLTIEDPYRFRKVRKVGAFVGLVRKMDQSGDQDKELGITKSGDSYLRNLLVQSAHHILGPFGRESDLRTWGLELAGRGGRGAKQRAVVAVARKLSVLLLALWRSGEEYIPVRHPVAHASAEQV